MKVLRAASGAIKIIMKGEDRLYDVYLIYMYMCGYLFMHTQDTDSDDALTLIRCRSLNNENNYVYLCQSMIAYPAVKWLICLFEEPASCAVRSPLLR